MNELRGPVKRTALCCPSSSSSSSSLKARAIEGAATVAKPKQAQKMQKHVYIQDIYSCLPHNIHFRPYFSWTGCGSWSDQDQAKIVWQWLSHNNWGRHNE